MGKRKLAGRIKGNESQMQITTATTTMALVYSIPIPKMISLIKNQLRKKKNRCRKGNEWKLSGQRKDKQSVLSQGVTEVIKRNRVTMTKIVTTRLNMYVRKKI